MTAVVKPPSFSNLDRPPWDINGGQGHNAMDNNGADLAGMFAARKALQRSNSSSSIASNSSTSTVVNSAPPQTNGTPQQQQSAGDQTLGYTGQPGAARKRPNPKGQWLPGNPEGQGTPAARPQVSTNGMNGVSMHQPSSVLQSQGQMSHQNGAQKPASEGAAPGSQPVLYLLSLNGTFERKTMTVPFFPDTLRIGRQTNAKTVPTPINGYFDSKVLSRQHAEIWADRNGKIWIRDIKSSNGTFVNGTRLSPENRESEPHELQTQDHLELGIDIVSEDQKTVVHHKVAAKVEHAGMVNPAGNILDMGFQDLDASGSLPVGNGPFRGRTASQVSANRMIGPGQPIPVAVNPAAHQRHLWLNPITTEHIVKRLNNEMRNARLQNADLKRTGQFINALLSKEDIKNPDKPESGEALKPQHMVNGNGSGNGMSFRSDGGKTRFSDPPAPPPSQPLPEKPDIPSLKRVATEKPKSQSIPPENVQQILQLTEALQNAKKEIDSHTARVRELEEMFQQEREARLMAEDMARKAEETGTAKVNGSAEPEEVFDLPAERERARPTRPEAGMQPEELLQQAQPQQQDLVETAAAMFQSRIDSMVNEMLSLKEQLEAFRLRAEKAETERDEERKTLAQVVMQIRQRDEEEQQRAAERRSRSRSKARSRPGSRSQNKSLRTDGKDGAVASPTTADGSVDDMLTGEETDVPTPSRATSVTADTVGKVQDQNPALVAQSVPYASMIGVVLFGMGLMAYINGWQPQLPRVDQ